MDLNKAKTALAAKLPSKLVNELISDFSDLRLDAAIGATKSSAAGKFTESIVQVLQQLERGSYDEPVKVDTYLTSLESRPSTLPDDLRICVNRVAKASYSLRNKRGIAHKGSIDPNRYDILLLASSAQWLMAELLRTVSGLPMSETGRLIEEIVSPVGSIIEDFGGKKLVLVKTSARKELLILFHSYYPHELEMSQINESLSRTTPKAISSRLSELRSDRLIERVNGRYKLTRTGLSEAINLLKDLNSAA